MIYKKNGLDLLGKFGKCHVVQFKFTYMEEISLKSEMTKDTLYRTLHLYQDGDRYFLRRDLYKSKNRKTLLLTHEFEVLLINLTIHLPPPFNGVNYQHYCGIPDLNFDFGADGWNLHFKISREVAEHFLVRDIEYEITNDDAEESVQNFIRKVRLKSILD